jgi:hypothetical protein
VDVGVCRECCVETDLPFEDQYPTDAELRADDDLVTESI